MLHELAATQMEHELREDREFGREAERVGVVGTVLRELRAEPNQRAVDPPQNVRHGLSLSASRRSYLFQQALRGQSRDNHSGALLIERGGHGLHVREVHVPASADGGHAAAQPAVGVRVRGHQLQTATAVLNGRLLAVAHFEVERQRRRGVDAAQIPRVRAALCLSILSLFHCYLADFQLAHAGTRLLERHARTDAPAHLELLRRLQLDRRAEPHHQRPRVYPSLPPRNAHRPRDTRPDTPGTRG